MATNKWIGPAIGSFAKASDWSLGHVPYASEDVVINTGSAAAIIGSSSYEEMYSFSLGSNDALLANSGSTFQVENGTGPNVNNGTINVFDGEMDLGTALGPVTFNNSSTGPIQLESTTASQQSRLVILGYETILAGSGSIEMTIGGPDTSNIIEGAYKVGSVLVNQSETIPGTGTIGGGINDPFTFTNNYVIDTNNNTSYAGGILNIEGVGGVFTNNSIVDAGNGGTLILGMDGEKASIVNTGVIELEASSKTTKMEIAGNVTVSSSSTGFNATYLGGSDPANDQVVSDGKAATLNLVDQTLLGAGSVGDAHLTLHNKSGSVIDADDSGQLLTLNTGSHTITNQGTLEADGGDLTINSRVNNTGTMEALGGGLLSVNAAVSGSGAVNIGHDGTLDTDTTIAGNVTFTGTAAQLVIDNGYANGGIGGNVVGAQSGDSIDFEKVSYSPAVQALWDQTSSTGGTLSLMNGSSAFATLNLAGTYTTGSFSVSNDSGSAQVKLT